MDVDIVVVRRCVDLARLFTTVRDGRGLVLFGCGLMLGVSAAQDYMGEMRVYSRSSDALRVRASLRAHCV